MGKFIDTTFGITVEYLSLTAADRADMLVDNGTGTLVIADFANPAIVPMYVNFEMAALWDILISTYEDYLVYRRMIPVVANKEDYALPEDFYKFRKIFPIVSGERCKPLKKFNLKDLGQASVDAAILVSQIEDTRYKVTGSRLWLYPEPSSAAQLELWYVPQFPYLKNFDDLVPHQIPNGWEDYVVEGVAARLLEKEESDASAQRKRQKEVLQRIMVLAEDRDVGEPFQMQDTEGYLG